MPKSKSKGRRLSRTSNRGVSQWLIFDPPSRSSTSAEPVTCPGSCAWLIAAAQRKAEELGKPFTVAVVDESGVLKGLLRMDNAALVSVQVAQDKAYTAAGFTSAMFRRSHSTSFVRATYSQIDSSTSMLPVTRNITAFSEPSIDPRRT